MTSQPAGDFTANIACLTRIQQRVLQVSCQTNDLKQWSAKAQVGVHSWATSAFTHQRRLADGPLNVRLTYMPPSKSARLNMNVPARICLAEMRGPSTSRALLIRREKKCPPEDIHFRPRTFAGPRGKWALDSKSDQQNSTTSDMQWMSRSQMLSVPRMGDGAALKVCWRLAFGSSKACVYPSIVCLERRVPLEFLHNLRVHALRLN